MAKQEKKLEDFLDNNFDHCDNAKAEIEIDVKEEIIEDVKDDPKNIKEGLKTKKKGGKKVSSCDLCGKTFNRPRKLTWHMETHSGKIDKV